MCSFNQWGLRLRKVKTLAPGHTASECQDLDLDSLPTDRPQEALHDKILRTQATSLFWHNALFKKWPEVALKTQMHSPQSTGQEGIQLSSHLARQGWVAVLCRAVGDH